MQEETFRTFVSNNSNLALESVLGQDFGGDMYDRCEADSYLEKSFLVN